MRAYVTFTTSVGFAALATAVAVAQPTIHTYDGWAHNLHHGRQVAGLGDVDGDGRADFGVADEERSYIRSGATGQTLFSVFHGVFKELGPLGDLDADGTLDVLIEGEVRSGAGGALLLTDNRLHEHDPPGDVDLDGHDDWLNGQPIGGVNHSGVIQVISGKDGSYVMTSNGVHGGFDYFGASYAGLGDLDGDGVPDYGGTPDGGGSYESNYVAAFSGKDGSLLWPVVYLNTTYDMLRRANDFDGDGVRDLALAAAYKDAWILSGKTGAVLWHGGPTLIHRDLRGGGDYDGDGVEDLVKTYDSVSQGLTHQVLSGAGGGAIYQRTWDTWQAGQPEFGKLHVFAGDVDGDGRSDVIQGRPYADPGFQTPATSTSTPACRAARGRPTAPAASGAGSRPPR